MPRAKCNRAAIQLSWIAAIALAAIALLTATSRSAPPIRRGGQTLYVDASVSLPHALPDGTNWTWAFNSLQDALAMARIDPAVDSIWVADGVYRPDFGQSQTPLNQLETFSLVSGVSIYGGFAGGETDLSQRDPKLNKCTLSGDLLGNDGPGGTSRADNSLHVITADVSVQWALLDGFVIRAGNAVSSAGEGGGGMLIDGGGVTVTGCRFESNMANRRGGAILNDHGAVNAINCEFVGNSVTGIGPRGTQIDGSGGAIHTVGGGVTRVVNTTLQNNVAKNKVGAVYAGAGATTIANSTIALNHAEEAGGGVYVNDDPAAVASVENAILWANRDVGGMDESAQLHVTTGGVALINYSTVQGWRGILDGLGNDQRVPRFVDDISLGLDYCGDRVDSAPIDLHIQAGSPTIDAGNNDANTDVSTIGPMPLPLTDHDGLPRRVDDPATVDGGSSMSGPPLVDRGAFEFQPDDCNHNGWIDAVEVAGGSNSDCNANDLPDECDLFAGNSRDCNVNLIPDECDIAAGSAADANGDGAIDVYRFFVDQDVSGGAADGTSWANAFSDLSAALAASAMMGGGCTEVWVAQGIYFPNTNGLTNPAAATFALSSGVKVYGGFAGDETLLSQRNVDANPTVLSCDFDGNDVSSNGREENCDRAVTADAVDATTRFDGFVVTGGDATGRGGGMVINNSGLTVANCAFVDNFAGQDGGGVSVIQSCMRFEACRFDKNVSRRGGGGLDALDSNLEVSRCVFTTNRGEVGPGGAAFSVTSALIDGCTFAANTGESLFAGGAISFITPGATPSRIFNCTFAANVTIDGFGDIMNNTGLSVVNSAFFDTSISSFGGNSSIVIRHNCGRGNAGSTDAAGNIGGDPFFVRPPSPGDPGDLRLRPDSICIDWGTNGPVNPDADDLDGNPRIVGCGVDAGAYESQRLTRLGDYDGDCEIDLDDYFIFEICAELSGPAQTPPFDECVEWFDSDGDSDIDLRDFRSFADLFGS